MRKIKLYLYPQAIPHLHDAIPEYRNSVPFSQDGIAQHCELVDPKDAEFFYCGQFSDKDSWLLHSSRFEYFDTRPRDHVFDIEGDWADMSIPGWLDRSILTAMNAEPNHRNGNVMVRPGCSMLLMDLLKRDLEYVPHKKNGFYFRGQRIGRRDYLREALILANVPHFFEYNNRWNAPTPVSEPIVQQYEQEMLEWSWALCPSGNGHGMTMRWFEACALGRPSVVIADNLLFADHCTIGFSGKISSNTPVEQLARYLAVINEMPDSDVTHCGQRAFSFYQTQIKTYFKDPTLYFLAWAESRGLIENIGAITALNER